MKKPVLAKLQFSSAIFTMLSRTSSAVRPTILFCINDKIYGLAGNDKITDGLGSDQISAGSGDDTINLDGTERGDTGAQDVVYGEKGKDDINAQGSEGSFLLIYGGDDDGTFFGGSRLNHGRKLNVSNMLKKEIEE